MTTSGLAARYRATLERWLPSARRWLYRLPHDPECLCYGVGYHNHWAIQAHTTAFAAVASLAADPETDATRTGFSRDELLETALAMLRFTLRGHLAGSGACADGQRWGHSWISALCQERMQHGIEAIAAALTPRDLEGLQAMLLSEADWLLDQYRLVAGLTGPTNRPESNLWNGALLCRAATLHPEAPRADEYLDRGQVFLINGLSMPADATSPRRLDGKPVRERFVGANVFDSGACNHHGYLNFGYLGITLSNVAMLHFFYRGLGRPAPEALVHHVADVWPLFKACIFPDGRLARIGGDTRVRYCYCQDYLIPVWLLMRDLLGDRDVEAFEHGWLDQVATEQARQADGAFLGERLAAMADASPLYYTRLEGDRAVSLSMGACWRRRFGEFSAVPATPTAPLEAWQDAYHGACLVRTPQRLASWVWGAAEAPQGLCLHPDTSAMAEWQHNLAGHVAGPGAMNSAVVQRHHEAAFPGGFATCGRVRWRSEKLYAEGEPDVDTAVEDLAVAALPDGVTVVGLQHARTLHRVFLREAKGLFLQIPNDVYNGFRRTYAWAGGGIDRRGRDGSAACDTAPDGWLSVDDRLGVVALFGAPLTILHPAEPRITIRAYPWNAHARAAGGCLYVDQICMGAIDTITACPPDTTLFDVGFAVLAGADTGATGRFAEANHQTRLAAPTSEVRLLRIRGADGRDYAIAANFGDVPRPIALPWPGRVLTAGNATAALAAGETWELPAGQAAVVALT